MRSKRRVYSPVVYLKAGLLARQEIGVPGGRLTYEPMNQKYRDAMQVRELMTESPAMCTPETSLEEVARMMIEKDCGAIPVVEDSNARKIVGIVTDRDITTRIVARGQNPLQKRAADAMTNAVVTVRPEDSVERCAELMEKNQVRRVIVARDGQACIGIVAQADIARQAPMEVAAEMLEEISRPARTSAPASI